MTHRALVLGLLLSSFAVSDLRAEDRFWLTRADRIEYHTNDEITLWELQGWYGGDLHKFWWKAEGDAGGGASDETSFQFLYSRAITAYFDFQIGAAYEDHITDDDLALVVGIEGLMPYNVEIDAATFLTDHGDVLLRGEVEREILLTQRVLLFPRIKLHASFQDIDDRSTSSGINDIAVFGPRPRETCPHKPHMRRGGDTAPSTGTAPNPQAA